MQGKLFDIPIGSYASHCDARLSVYRVSVRTAARKKLDPLLSGLDLYR